MILRENTRYSYNMVLVSMSEKGEIKWIINPHRIYSFLAGSIAIIMIFIFIIVLIYPNYSGSLLFIIMLFPLSLIALYLGYLGNPIEFGFSVEGLYLKFSIKTKSGKKIIFHKWENVLFYKSEIKIKKNNRIEGLFSFSPRRDMELIRSNYEKLLKK